MWSPGQRRSMSTAPWEWPSRSKEVTTHPRTPALSPCVYWRRRSFTFALLFIFVSSLFLLSPHRFAIWNTMMGTSILSIPWGIKQVIVVYHLVHFTLLEHRLISMFCVFRPGLLWASSSSSSSVSWCSTVATSSSSHQRPYVSTLHCGDRSGSTIFICCSSSSSIKTVCFGSVFTFEAKFFLLKKLHFSNRKKN